MRTPRSFEARPAEEQRALARETWCATCSKPDLGLRQPVEYEEGGIVYVAGRCVVCDSPVVAEILSNSSPAAVPHLQPYSLVQVLKLTPSRTEQDGWRLNQRVPVPGDIGTVVEVLRAPDLPEKYVVECSGPDGRTIWLEEFLAEELAPAAQ